LAQTMRRFGRGDMDARASDEGPAELAEMARRFNEMASAIGRQREDRRAFIAGVVHDLRTPLSVLRMSADLATTGGSQLPPERLVKVLGTVARQVTRLERMAGDLLESVTIEAGTVALRAEEVDARDVATEVAALYAAASAKHDIELQLPDRPVVMSCDRMRIEQVLSNLISNAVKYSPAGGKVAVQVEESGGDVVFRVRDEGVGMSEADAAMAFEPFRRSAVLRDEVPGSGLGLFIVQRLVEAHGGRITLHTAPGDGSTFEVRIPAARSRQPSGRIAAPDDEEPHRVLHVPHQEEARARPPNAAPRGGARQERHH
ncbi:MAG TPA: HAMP domain-containing sensor histidine kinase, partial [Labilithrix sp.]|nr:HAMP domain-containing sensor histidine kinase [Labilithrix sp.]